MRTREILRSALVIARRDFTATVFSKAFLFFLLGPLFPVLLASLFGAIGARVASESAQPVVAVIATQAEFDRLSAARDRLSEAMGGGPVIRLRRFDAGRDSAAQQAELLKSTDPPVIAVLTDALSRPRLTGAVREDGGAARQLRMMIADARAPVVETGPPLTITRVGSSSAVLVKGRALTAQAGQFLLFFLTILLAGMLLSQLIEEKSNKIIEVLAAAVPIDSIFLGKLFAMLAASLLGILVWAAVGAGTIALFVDGGIARLPPPAVGWTAYFALAVVYFTMNYLLLGAVFLSIGAQASTVREVQTLSMPVTMGQVVILGIAAIAVGAPDSPAAIAAAIFPLSSPLVMVARAAEQTAIWPHLLAIAWQLLWVALILHWGAKLFRRSVLKSGRPFRWPWSRRQAA